LGWRGGEESWGGRSVRLYHAGLLEARGVVVASAAAGVAAAAVGGAVTRARVLAAALQGLTLVHFSA